METCCRNSFKLFIRICVPQKPLPSVNHMQTDQAHQKSQPLRQDKKPNSSSGQPMLWKRQKPVVIHSQASFSLFNPSIASLQMRKTEPRARWRVLPLTPEEFHQLLWADIQLPITWVHRSPQLIAISEQQVLGNQWNLCSKGWSESALVSRCFTFFFSAFENKMSF